MGKDSSPPAAPDPYATANAQGAANVKTAIAQGIINNPNVVTPFGRQTVTWGDPAGQASPTFNQAGYDAALQAWQNSPVTDMAGYNADLQTAKDQGYALPTMDSYRGAAPDRSQFMSAAANPDGIQQPTVTQELSPANQQLLESQQRISQNLADTGEAGLSRVGQSMSAPLNESGVNDLQNRTQRAYLDRLDPIWNQQQQQTETQLVNQGLRPGTEAYDKAMHNFYTGRNDAYGQAILAANSMRPQALQEELAIRNQPLTELNALRTGAQPQVPQFQQFQGGSIAPPPIAQAVQNAYGQNLNAYNASQANNASFMNGLMSLGGKLGAAWIAA